MTATIAEALWLKSLFKDLKIPIEKSTLVYGDNQACLSMIKNPGHGHGRTKHIDCRHHFIRKSVKDGNIKLKYCPTKHMVGDIMTKAIKSPSLFEDLRDKILGHKNPYDFPQSS